MGKITEKLVFSDPFFEVTTSRLIIYNLKVYFFTGFIVDSFSNFEFIKIYSLIPREIVA